MKKINGSHAAKRISGFSHDSLAIMVAEAIFDLLLQQWDVVKNWCIIPGGFFSVRADHNLPGAIFAVKGGWYDGMVAVIYHLGTFELYLVNEDMEVSKVIGLARPDEVVKVIDKEIGHLDRLCQMTEQEKSNRMILLDTLKMYSPRK